jgi:uncharacterized protein (TIGR02722 family)
MKGGGILMVINKKYLIVLFPLLCALLIHSGCGGKRVTYGDAGAVETLTPEFGSTDLQTIAARMIDSLLVHPVLKDRPVIYVSRIRNKTSEHIDTEAITDKIKTALIKSGKVRFTAISEVNEEMIQQLKYQTESGMVDPATRTSIGKQIGADLLLYGDIISIVKKEGRKEDVYYKINLELADLKTGIIEWSEEEEIRKQAKKGIVGW